MAEWRDILNRERIISPLIPITEPNRPSGSSPRAGRVWGRRPFAASRDHLAGELEGMSSAVPLQQRPQTQRPQQRDRAVERPARTGRLFRNPSSSQCRRQHRYRNRCTHSQPRREAGRRVNSRHFRFPSASWRWRSTDFLSFCIKARCIQDWRERYLSRAGQPAIASQFFA